MSTEFRFSKRANKISHPPPPNRQTHHTRAPRGAYFFGETDMEPRHVDILIYVGVFIAVFALIGFYFDRRQRRIDEARREEKLQRERLRVETHLDMARYHRASQAGLAAEAIPPWPTERRNTVRAFSVPSPAPHPDYLDQHLIWQNLSASIPEAAEDWRPPTCSSSAYASGGGGDFGGGGASSSWESSSSSDSSSSSSSNSSSSSSSD